MSKPMAYGDIHRRLHEAIAEVLDDEDVHAVDLMCALTCVTGELIAHDVPRGSRALASRLFSNLLASVINDPDRDLQVVIRSILAALAPSGE